MIGAIIGDIVGSRFECWDHKSKEFKLFGGDGIVSYPCEYTDDTVVTVAVADALLCFEKINDDAAFKKKLVERMHHYGRSRMNAGYGQSFYLWLKNGSTEPYNSYGNGSAMRVAPVGWVADTLEETERIAKLSAEVTHDHPEGIKGAQSVAAAIWMARNGMSKEEIKEYIERKYYPQAFSRTLDEIRENFEFDESCQETVPVAMVAFYESEGFEDALRCAVSLGGDSDTVADITGGMAEAFYGIPEDIEKEAMKFLDDEMRAVAVTFMKKYRKKEETSGKTASYKKGYK